MITLNTDQGLVSVQSWDDVVSRPGFVENLDPQQHELDAVIGHYLFKDKVKCGLSNCHTAHGRGYIVLTKIGLQTNIGHDCGRKYFGLDFETMSKKHDRDFEEQNNRNSLVSFTFGVENIEGQIRQLRDGETGANRLHALTRHLRVPGNECPSELVTMVTRMIRVRNPILTLTREATADEAELASGAQRAAYDRDNDDDNAPAPPTQYIEERISEIRGFDALYPENDLRQLLVIDVEQELKAFKEEDIDSMTFERLRYWAKWVSTVIPKLERVEVVLESARQLLRQDNLELFDRVLKNRDARKQFKVYIRQLPVG